MIARRHIRSVTAATGLLVCAAAVGACGSDSPDRPSGASSQPAGRTTSTGGGGVDPGAFPDRPQVLLRFDKRPSGWPESVRRGGASAGFDGNAYVLEVPAGAPALRVAAETEVEPATRGVLLETTVRLAERGASGLFCRGSAATASGYALSIERRGRWTIERFEDGRATRLGSGPLLRQAGGGTLIRFICGAAVEGEPLTLALQVGAIPLEFVRDPHALAPAGPASVGILARSGASDAVRPSFAYLAVSLAS